MALAHWVRLSSGLRSVKIHSARTKSRIVVLTFVKSSCPAVLLPSPNRECFTASVYTYSPFEIIQHLGIA